MAANVPATKNVHALRVALMAAQRAARFGARMRERRKELELSQSEVAERIPVASVNKDYISRWERGAVEASDAYLESIASALETTVGDLMAGPLDERPEKGSTPDLLGAGEETQLDRIEATLQELVAVVDQLVSQSGARTVGAVAAGNAKKARKPAASKRKRRATPKK